MRMRRFEACCVRPVPYEEAARTCAVGHMGVRVRPHIRKWHAHVPSGLAAHEARPA